MGPVANFIIALTVAVTSLVTGSIAWPRLTTASRPQLLQSVHDVAIKTSIGQQAANVLGVSDETNIQPVNFGQVFNSVLDTAKNAAQKRMQTVIVGNAVNQLSSQFEKLPREQKEQIQQILCKPLDSTQSAVSGVTQ
jgi:hypothetical protein